MKIWKSIDTANAAHLIGWHRDRLSDFRDTIQKFGEDANLTNAVEMYVAFYWAFIDSNAWLRDGYNPRGWINRPKENIDGEKFTIGWEIQDHSIYVNSYRYGALGGLWKISLTSGSLSTVLKARFDRPKTRKIFGLSFKKQPTDVPPSFIEEQGSEAVFITKLLLPVLFKARDSGDAHFKEWQKRLIEKV